MKRSFSWSDLRRSSISQETTGENDNQTHVFHKQLAMIEKSFSTLTKDFSNLAVDSERMIDRQDCLALTLSTYAEEESPTVQLALASVSDNIFAANEYLRVLVKTLQNQVIHSLSSYAAICKKERDSFSGYQALSKRRATALNALEKLKSKSPGKSQSRGKKEIKSQETVVRITKQLKELENQLRSFEKTKAEDLKKALQFYIHGNIVYHAKALELYTKSYQALSKVNIDDHLQHIDNIQFPPDQPRRLNIVRSHSLTSVLSKR